MLASAFLVAWAAEAAQFLISQGLALAILAWVQTLPEFAVEAVIAWQAGGDAPHCFVATAGGMPLASGDRELHGRDPAVGWTRVADDLLRRGVLRADERRPLLAPIVLEDEHAVEVLTTVPPLAYFAWIWHKGSIDLIDAAVLIAMYVVYLAILWRLPPGARRRLAEAPRIRAGRRRGPDGSAWSRWAASSRSAPR